jgi:hypothetical protein
MQNTTCKDCGAYTPQDKKWGNCDEKKSADGSQVVEGSRKACKLFRYYAGGK